VERADKEYYVDCLPYISVAARSGLLKEGSYSRRNSCCILTRERIQFSDSSSGTPHLLLRPVARRSLLIPTRAFFSFPSLIRSYALFFPVRYPSSVYSTVLSSSVWFTARLGSLCVQVTACCISTAWISFRWAFVTSFARSTLSTSSWTLSCRGRWRDVTWRGSRLFDVFFVHPRCLLRFFFFWTDIPISKRKEFSRSFTF
jgi:hypothetical protein